MMQKYLTITYSLSDELDVDIITKYCAKSSPVITGLENRITILSSRDDEDSSKEDQHDTTTQQATTAAAEPTTEAADGDVLDDITAGVNQLGSDLQKAGEDLLKLPSEIPNLNIFGNSGRRRRR